MKFVAPSPTCAGRHPVMLLFPVAFDGNVVPVGGLVELSDTQAAELAARGACMAVDPADAPGGHFMVVRPRAAIEVADENATRRERKRWMLRNRKAMKGRHRLDASESIVAQVNRIVGR